MPRSQPTPFYRRFHERVKELGGMFNSHLHLDRAYTLDDRYLASEDVHVLDVSHVSLHKKHALINALHAGPAYDKEDLLQRVNACLDVMVECGTVRADTLVDVTSDRVGHEALATMGEIKKARRHEIDLRLAAYSPLGFLDAEPERWEVFREGARSADFLAALPEADDTDEYPDHIGFMEHCRRFLVLAQETAQMLHVHTDQRNEPTESGTERLIEAVRRFGSPPPIDGGPSVWAVHAISPTTYEEPRFQEMVDGLLETNIGIICCPSAALGMRQLRPIMGPTDNSIPRVLDLLAAGVPVRLASDNIADICSPSTTADLTDEVFTLSAAIRYYHVNTLARLAAGQPLSTDERERVRDHLKKNAAEIEKVLRATDQAALS